jgi:branched-chain amino acid aminotransferase
MENKYKILKIWKNGELKNFEDATTHVLTHALHYGSGVFEGIRAYSSGSTTYIFRLEEHVQRLIDSAKIYRMELPYTKEEIMSGIIETIKANNLKSCYIRPIAYRGLNILGLNPKPCPVDVVIAAWEWESYLGQDGVENGVAVQVSSWNRLAPNTIPNVAKATGNYLSSQLIKMEALENGYEEGIALDVNGLVSEGSGENVFIVKNNIVYTPQDTNAILAGITRDSVMQILKNNNIQVIQKSISREQLYLADEIFMTGTAAEITPITSVDRINVKKGKVGTITKLVQNQYHKCVSNQIMQAEKWCTKVE